MATLAKHRIAQAGHHFKGGIQNSDHGAQLIGNYNVGGDFNFNQTSGQDYQERLRACRNALHSGRSDPQDDRAKIIAVKTKTGRIIQASCEWITTHTKYRSWESDSTSSKLLWISSAGEHGKTMMAIYLSQVLEDAALRSKNSTVLYFFIDRQNKKDTAADVLCGLLTRLLKARNDSDELTKHLLEEYEMQKDALFGQDAIEALWRVFVNMITDPTAGQIYCIIDGLDYCTEDSLRRLISRITNFFLERTPVVNNPRLNTDPHNHPSAGPNCAQKLSEQRRDAGLKMILVSREKPEWVVEQLSEFARIDIGVRGRKDGAISRHTSKNTRRQKTLASVVADVIRKQRMERVISHEDGSQSFAFDVQTGLAIPSTEGIDSNHAVLAHRKSAMFMTETPAVMSPLTYEPSLRSPSPAITQGSDTRKGGDQQVDDFSMPVRPDGRDEVTRSSRSRLSAFEIDPTPQGGQHDLASAPPLPPRPQSHSYKMSNDQYEQDSRYMDDIMVDEENEEDYGRKALRSYTRARLEELIAERQWPTEIQASFVRALEHCGDDSFLWVDLAIEEIRKVATDFANIETVLKSLPPTLTEMYSYILLKIPPKLTDLVASLLRWSVGALQPLTILELTVALNLTTYNQDAASNLLRTAVSACGNMLTINKEDETVNIVHHSLVDFLSADSSPIHQASRLSQFIVCTSDNHGSIANSCIAYLEAGCFREGSICMEQDEVAYKQRLAQFPFMKYASFFWMDHLQHAERPIIDLSSPFFQSKSKLRRSWWHTFWAAWVGGGTWFAPMNFTLLHLAARFNLVCIAELLLRRGDLKERIDKRDSHGYTPLEYSVIDGHMHMFQFLTGVGATQKGSAETLLELACRVGKRDIAEALLAKGYDVNMHAHSKSAKESIYKVTKFLPGTILEKTGWKFHNRYFGEQETPLIIAAMYGHDTIIGLLLDHGAFIDAGTTKGFNPLHAAADQGQTECVEVLLKRGAMIFAKTTDEWLALHFAAWRGRLSVLRIFLDMGVPLESMTVKSKTALHLSAYAGHAEVVRALANRGANLELKSHKGETPLHLATRSGKPQVVELLLSLGARRDAVTNEGKTSREIAQASKTAEGEECLRILETFGTVGYQPWQPPEDSDALATDGSASVHTHKSLAIGFGFQLDFTQSSQYRAPGPQLVNPSTAVHPVRKSPPPTPQLDQRHLQIQATDLWSVSAQPPTLARVQSEPTNGPSRFADDWNTAQRYRQNNSHVTRITEDSIQMPLNLSRESQSISAPSNTSFQGRWQDPSSVPVSQNPYSHAVQHQRQDSAPSTTITQNPTQTSLIQMVNSMSLSSRSSPKMQGPSTPFTPYPNSAQPTTSATTSPYTQASCRGSQNSSTSAPTTSTPDFSISPPPHAATASAITRYRSSVSLMQPSHTAEPSNDPQQRHFAQYKSQTVPIVQPQHHHQYSLAQPSLNHATPLQHPYSPQQQQRPPLQQSYPQPQQSYPPPQQSHPLLQQPCHLQPPYSPPQQPYWPPQQSYYSPPQLHSPPQQPYAPPPTQSPQYSGNNTASTYNSMCEYNASLVTQPYNPRLGTNGNGLLFAPPPTQELGLKKRKSFLGGLIG